MARCRNACILVLGILLPRLQFPNAAQPPPREQHSAPSAPIPPNHDTSGGSNHCPGRTSVHPRRRLPRLQFPNAAQPQSRAHRSTPSDSISPPAAVLNKGNHQPRAHRGTPSVQNHPVQDRNSQGNHHPSATEGAPSRTLGRNQPAGSYPQQRQPPPSAQSHAPSAQIAPPTIPHRSPTAAEGAASRTLGRS